MCVKCNKGGCRCGNSISLSKIKGDPGKDSTVPGPAGVGISSITTHSTLPNTWLITYTNGTTGIIAAPSSGGGGGSGTTTYFAWANDNIGSGFTVTPSNKLYMGITDTLATTGTPIAADFATKWFLINQPKLRYDDAAFIGMVESIDGRGTASDISFTTIIPALTVPAVYMANSKSYIEYSFEGMIELIDPIVSLPYGGLKLLVTINGNDFEIGNIGFNTPNQVAFKGVVSLYVDSSNNIRMNSILFSNASGYFGGVDASTFASTVGTATVPVIFSLSKVRVDDSHRKIHLHSHKVTAVNPSKTTII